MVTRRYYRGGFLNIVLTPTQYEWASNNWLYRFKCVNERWHIDCLEKDNKSLSRWILTTDDVWTTTNGSSIIDPRFFNNIEEAKSYLIKHLLEYGD